MTRPPIRLLLVLLAVAALASALPAVGAVAPAGVERYALVGRTRGDVVLTEWVERTSSGYHMVETFFGGAKFRTLDAHVGADGAIDSIHVRLYNPSRSGGAPREEIVLRRTGQEVRKRERKAGAKSWTTTVTPLEPGARLSSSGLAGAEWLLRSLSGERGRHDFRVVDPMFGDRLVQIEFQGDSDVRFVGGGSAEQYRLDGDGRILSGTSDVGLEFKREAWVDPARRRVPAGRPKTR